ncbi:hypothetical protein TWF718_008337 [Orbilia javanica]|uniref:Uncharacterized protein n=1 Tax=Orbilia javanica TaxID=47235 RepID=A0AAN8RD12_9PEZI
MPVCLSVCLSVDMPICLSTWTQPMKLEETGRGIKQLSCLPKDRKMYSVCISDIAIRDAPAEYGAKGDNQEPGFQSQAQLSQYTVPIPIPPNCLYCTCALAALLQNAVGCFYRQSL